MPILSSTRVGRGYRTTIPREARRLLELGVNDTLEWVYEDTSTNSQGVKVGSDIRWTQPVEEKASLKG